uniref:Nuclear factor erythroid 2-related factor 2 n=1 Tax=Pan troglodytes TaxID=9598 RepID=G2HHS2_PANTR|nr:nuclear factor erythroid 2-related factor 2 [Pan troglodytes]
MKRQVNFSQFSQPSTSSQKPVDLPTTPRLPTFPNQMLCTLMTACSFWRRHSRL